MSAEPRNKEYGLKKNKFKLINLYLMLKSVGIRKILNKCIKESHHSHIMKQIPHDLHRAHTDITSVTLLTLPDLIVRALILVTLLVSGTT
jgi:hypothetical protein